MPPSVSQRAEAAERQAKALQLRLGGASFEQIGRQLGGITPQRAHQLYKQALNRVVRQPNQEIIDLEVARLDQLLVAMWPKAMGGSGWAVDRCLGIMKRRAELLGLDAPTRHEVMTIDAIDAEIRQLEAELTRGRGGAPVEA